MLAFRTVTYCTENEETPCHAGQRRSAAVAKFASEALEAQGFDHGYKGYNKTVYALLKNPATFEPITQVRAPNGWLKRLLRRP